MIPNAKKALIEAEVQTLLPALHVVQDQQRVQVLPQRKINCDVGVSVYHSSQGQGYFVWLLTQDALGVRYQKKINFGPMAIVEHDWRPIIGLTEKK